jgi:hypothetical protein
MNKHTPEPVAKYSDIVSDGGMDPRNKFDVTPAPQPPREWVGLTEEQISAIAKKLFGFTYDAGAVRPFARTIDQALKEKNT